MLGDQYVSGPFHNKFSDRFNTPFINYENNYATVGLFKDKTYYCRKNEDDHYKVFCNDVNGSYNYIFTEQLFKQYFYTEKELRREKIKNLIIYEKKV